MDDSSFQYKVVTVPAVDEKLNAEIAVQKAEGYMVVSLTPMGMDIIILFLRTIAAT